MSLQLIKPTNHSPPSIVLDALGSTWLGRYCFEEAKYRDVTTVCSPDNRAVSFRHLQIFEKGGEWYITDVSQNGTKVNGKKITSQQKLAEGDLITVGLTKNENEFPITYVFSTKVPAIAAESKQAQDDNAKVVLEAEKETLEREVKALQDENGSLRKQRNLALDRSNELQLKLDNICKKIKDITEQRDVALSTLAAFKKAPEKQVEGTEIFKMFSRTQDQYMNVIKEREEAIADRNKAQQAYKTIDKKTGDWMKGMQDKVDFLLQKHPDITEESLQKYMDKRNEMQTLLIKERKELQCMMNQLTPTRTELAKLKTATAEHDKLLKEATAEHAKLIKANQDAAAERTKIENEVKQLKAELATAQAAVDSPQERYGMLQGATEEEQELSSMCGKLKDEVAKLKDEVAKLKEQLAAEERKNVNMGDANEEFRNEIDRLKADNKTLQARVENLQQGRLIGNGHSGRARRVNFDDDNHTPITPTKSNDGQSKRRRIQENSI